MKPSIKARVTLNGGHEIDADVVNPGGWFGRAIVIQVGIANNLNPFYIIEADSLSDAIDTLADSNKYGHLINVNEEDVEGDEEDLIHAGNDSHVVDLDNVSVCDFISIKYYVEIDDITEDNLVSGINDAINEWNDNV